MAESVRAKSARLLTEGRVMITLVDPAGVVAARIRGEGRVHDARFEAGAWSCSCEHRGPGCSHLVALRSVVALEAHTP